MPIEFYCTRCAKLLRVSDEDAGREAECPACGAAIMVPTQPAPSVEPEVPAPPPMGPPPTAPPAAAGADAGAPPGGSPFAAPKTDSKNPYASPTSFDATLPYSAPGQAGEIVPTQIDMGDALGQTWEIFKQNAGLLIGVGLIVLVINVGLGLISNLLEAQMGFDGLPLLIAYQVFSMVVGLYLGIGQSIISLRVARGEKAEVGDLFLGGPVLLPVIGGLIIYTLMAMVGLLCLIVPGIILMLMFGQAQLLIIDRKLPILEAFSMSQRITMGNKLTLFAFFVVLWLLGIAIVCPTCGLGIIFYQAFWPLAAAVVYLMMCGQPLVSQRELQPPFAPASNPDYPQ